VKVLNCTEIKEVRSVERCLLNVRYNKKMSGSCRPYWRIHANRTGKEEEETVAQMEKRR
jgi:hypothetical protein